MQPPQQCLARLEDLILFNERYAQFNFEMVQPHELTFQAGQYVSIKVSPEGLRRSYSIISPPDVKHQFDLLIDLKPMGPGGRFLKGLKFGDTIEMLAPMGRFIVPDDLQQEHLVFVATGSGISTFKCMIQDQLRTKKSTKQITLHWGMHDANDLFWLEEWQELMEAFPNFHFHPVVSNAPDEWTLCRGRVTDCLSVHTLPQNAAYFLCGNQHMIEDVTKFLTEQRQIAPTSIFTEKFY